MEATGVDGTAMATIMIFLVLALLFINPSIVLFFMLGLSFLVAKPMSSPEFSKQADPPEIHQAVPHSYRQPILPFIPETWQQWQQTSYRMIMPQRSK